MSARITLDTLSLNTPDNRPLFSNLSLTIGADRIGLVGRNGCGKTSLLNVMAGLRHPGSGRIDIHATTGKLDQHLDVSGLSWAQGLGIADARARLQRIEAGVPREEDVERAVWDLDSRVEASVARVGLSVPDLDHPLQASSGGERTRIALARLLLQAPDILLLDEPTNNLDAGGRALIVELVRSWRGGLVVASHDRELLEEVDRIVELDPVSCSVTGGGWIQYLATREARRGRLAREVDEAQAKLKQARSLIQQRAERKARSDGQGRAARRSRSQSKLYLNAQRERAQGTDRRNTAAGERQLGEAEEALTSARSKLAVETPLRIDMPASGLAQHQRLLKFSGVALERGGRTLFEGVDFDVVGPERIEVRGPNGAGKSSLLALARGTLQPTQGRIERHGKLAVLDQHVTFLDPVLTVRENCEALNPELSDNAIRANLAEFAFRNDAALKPVGVLSGGERMRAGLACLFAGPHMPSLLILDEPTNHLDIEAIELLEAALRGFDGALMVASHDTRFVDGLTLGRCIQLGDGLTS